MFGGVTANDCLQRSEVSCSMRKKHTQMNCWLEVQDSDGCCNLLGLPKQAICLRTIICTYNCMQCSPFASNNVENLLQNITCCENDRVPPCSKEPSVLPCHTYHVTCKRHNTRTSAWRRSSTKNTSWVHDSAWLLATRFITLMGL